MERGMNKVVLVTRKTRLQELIYRYNTIEQARFYIEHMGADFSDYVKEDKLYQKQVAYITEQAQKKARVQVIDREYMPHMILGTNDIVVTIGQDGMVANTMKYLTGQPLIGINPDPDRWDGILLPFEAGDIEKVLEQVIQGSFQTKKITMAEAQTNDGQKILAVNDLFIGQKTHISSRYDIIYREDREYQSSSGVIVSTGLGSTGWYRSVMAQMESMARRNGEEISTFQPYGWDRGELLFAVREPYPSKTTGTSICYGVIEEADIFQIISKMPENGVIFSDGMEADAIDFKAGMELTIGISKQKGQLVVS